MVRSTVVAGLFLALSASAARAQVTTRADLDSSGNETNGVSYWGNCSVDGRYVVFSSFATNLVPSDTNACQDVFLRDRVSGTTERVSVSTSGSQQTGDTLQNYALPGVSGDGRYVTFSSLAANLVTGDTNGDFDVFVRDRLLGTTTRVSVDGSGNEAVGGYSAFGLPSVDGRYVCFLSGATNLVAGDTNSQRDVFVKDLWTGSIDRASIGVGGVQATQHCGFDWFSDDGRYVVFECDDDALAPGDANGSSDVYLRDRAAGTTELVSLTVAGAVPTGSSFGGAISADGRYAFFTSTAADVVPGDTNGDWDVFMRDRTLGTTTRVNLGTGGVQALNHDSYLTAISTDGRYLLFWSLADNLVAGDTNAIEDLFLRDVVTGAIQRVNVDSAGNQATGTPVLSYSSLTADGQSAVFQSFSPNLVTGDTNNNYDIFVRTLPSPWANMGSSLAGLHGDPILYATGTFVPADKFALRLINARPSSLAMLFVSLGVGPGAPFKGGVLKTFPVLTSVILFTNAGGALNLSAVLPSLPSGSALGFQYAIQDPAAVFGVSLSNCMKGTVP